MEVASITGHKTLQTLKRYTHPAGGRTCTEIKLRRLVSGASLKDRFSKIVRSQTRWRKIDCSVAFHNGCLTLEI